MDVLKYNLQIVFLRKLSIERNVSYAKHQTSARKQALSVWKSSGYYNLTGVRFMDTAMLEKNLGNIQVKYNFGKCPEFE